MMLSFLSTAEILILQAEKKLRSVLFNRGSGLEHTLALITSRNI